MTTTATAPQIKRLSYRFDLKEVEGEAGTFEGYGNVFGVVDWYKEVVVKGAFKKTLKDRKASGRPIVLLWQHDTRQPIGTLTATEDDHGLKVTAKLTLGVKQADEAYLLLKSGAVGAMSIGFDVLKDEYDRESGIRYLKEIRLWEVSLVTFPANEASTVTGVKAATDFATIMKRDEVRRQRWQMIDALDTALYLALDDDDLSSEGKLASITTSLNQFRDAMVAWAAEAVALGVKSSELYTPQQAAAPASKDTPATPSKPSATEAAHEGTPAGGKDNDGAGTEPAEAELAEAKALAQQIKAAAAEQEALEAIRSLKSAMSA